MFDYVIVGSGLAGCVMAERLANRNYRVLIIEKRYHIGGNCYDEYNEDGILIHRYGPHIFRTNSKLIWDYLSSFTEWHYYQHKVLAYVDGMTVPFPINLDTVNKLLNTDYNSEEFKLYIEKVRRNPEEINTVYDSVTSLVGENLYEKFYKNYSKKQWGLLPEQLNAEVTSRIPVRFNRESRYFTEKYQGVPKYGYTKMIEKMLKKPNINILLNTDYKSIINDIKFKYLIYTGPIDYYFDYMYGKLPYRSLKFETETLPIEFYQEAGTINYPNDYDFTRITEYKYLTGQIHPFTTIVREYPADHGEPYYPVPTTENDLLYQKYKQETLTLKNVYFVGRLAEYRYYNMDQVIAGAFNVINRLSL